MKCSGRVSGLLLVAALLAAPADAWATSLIVPDNAPTIQAGLNARLDTVFVRPGDYAESPIVSYDVTLMPTPDAVALPTLAGLGFGQVEITVSVERLDVLAPVVLGPGSPPLGQSSVRGTRASASPASQVSNCIDFLSCRLRGGLIDSTNYVDLQCMTFQKCTIEGDVGAPPRYGGLGLRVYCLVESCTVNGTFTSDLIDPRIEVRGCTFTGHGVGFAVSFGGGGSAVIEGCTIRGYESGINANGENGGTVTNNLVEDCSFSGINVGHHSGSIRGNAVRRCGFGILSSASETQDVTDNVVEDCEHFGILVDDITAYRTRVSGNVVHDCGEDGIRISEGPVLDLVVERNTMTRNGHSGLIWEVPEVQVSAIIRNNIGYANGVNGVQWTANNATSVTCNDWFGNSGGDVAGAPPSPTDFSVNPLFCDEAHNDFHLLDISPLANQAACGQIGAFGVACGATATLVARFTAERRQEGIRIEWALGPGTPISEAWLERSTHGPEGPWTKPVTEGSWLGEARMELDRDARPDQSYWYRLMTTEAGSRVELGRPIEVSAVALTFALGKIGPSPSSGPISIEFSLAGQANIDIGVFDLLGRRAGTLARGEWPAGVHQVRWTDRAPAGIYLVRYRFPAGEDRRRLIRLPY